MRVSLLHSFFGIACSAALLGPIHEASALTVRQEAVDIEFSFNANGEAVVVNKVKFNVSNGPMTAMIIENMALNPTEFKNLRYDLDGQEKFSEVILTKIGNKKYDLEAVPKIPNGNAYLSFAYNGNVLTDGFIGKTQSSFGELIYFDWAPMQWASALKYRKVTINIPHQVDKSECTKEILFPKYLGYSPTEGTNIQSDNGLIKTEKALNARNKIDIQCVESSPEKYYLQLIVVQEKVAPREAQRIQFYMPSDFFSIPDTAMVRAFANGTAENSADNQAKVAVDPSLLIHVTKTESQFSMHSDGVSEISHKIYFDIPDAKLQYTEAAFLQTTQSYDEVEIKNPLIIQSETGATHQISPEFVSLNNGYNNWRINISKLKAGAYLLSYNYQLNSIRSGILGQPTPIMYGESHSNYFFFRWNGDELLPSNDPALSESVHSVEDSRIRTLILPIEMPDAAISDDTFYELLGIRRGASIRDLNKAKGKIRVRRSIPQLEKIDLSTTDIDGKHHLTLILHSGDDQSLNTIGNTELLIYIQKDLLPFIDDRNLKSESGNDSFNPDAFLVPKSAPWILLLLAAAGGGAGIYRRKNLSKKQQQKVDEIKFKTVGDDLWETPELQVGGFAEAGKIAQHLHPIEVGLILGLELQQIVGIMAQALGDQKKLIIRSLEPIKAYPASDAALEPIEKAFVDIFDELGNVAETKLQDFIENVITGIQEKTWDCDLDATRKYYLNVLYKNPEEQEKDKLEFKLIDDKYFDDPSISKPMECDDAFWHHRYYWRHYHGYYTNRYRYDLGLSQMLNMGYQQFLQSSVCFNGCFTQPNMENVCHSACHSACHDACHSACHDACHSACHSACHHACHSACVSGGAR